MITDEEAALNRKMLKAYGQQTAAENKALEYKVGGIIKALCWLLIPVAIATVLLGQVGNNTHHEYADHGFTDSYRNSQDVQVGDSVRGMRR